MNPLISHIIFDRPFFIGRIAGIELLTAYHVLHNHTLERSQNKAELENNAGIRVANEASLDRYVTKLIEAYEHCTCIAEWDPCGAVYAKTGKGQDLIRMRTPQIPKVNALTLEPYYDTADMNSWMPLLKGKRILIIHPFVKTIEKQIPRLKEIFPGRSWFEDCTFMAVKPPFTLAGNHQDQSWETHYQPFVDSINSEFDVALVAAGGYGMLIADHLYSKLGKSVLYIGGALQLFFGIIGRRWFENQAVMDLVNDAWTRPLPADKPVDAAKVEKGCYW